MRKLVVVIPNWNGADSLRTCLDSLLAQTLQAHIIVVDNGSHDGSAELVTEHYPDIELIRHTVNKGYAGGVNPGFRRAIELGADYAAPFNNDAIADRLWLQKLAEYLDAHDDVGIASCKVLGTDKTTLDTTGEGYTTWGLPYPRGRGEKDNSQYDNQADIFAASGAASLYRVSTLSRIGLLDEDFFAYYEDVDLSFRAQLAGYKIAYVPESVVYHATSSTGGRIKGFFTYQTMKNLPLLLVKNVPAGLLPTILPRFILAYVSFVAAALLRGQIMYALRGALQSIKLLPRKLRERRRIQRGSTVSSEYIRSMLTWDLPPDASRLRALRSKWHKKRTRSTP